MAYEKSGWRVWATEIVGSVALAALFYVIGKAID